jgi:hypothetical protein
MGEFGIWTRSRASTNRRGLALSGRCHGHAAKKKTRDSSLRSRMTERRDHAADRTIATLRRTLWRPHRRRGRGAPARLIRGYRADSFDISLIGETEGVRK